MGRAFEYTVGRNGHFPPHDSSHGRSFSDVSPCIFAYPDISPLCMTSACVSSLPESDVLDDMQVLHGCVTDVEETDKLQTLLATCCSG